MKFILAYLDPGSTSALLAAVLAGIAGVGAALRTYWNKLLFWKKDKPEPEKTVETKESTKEDSVIN